MSPAVKVSFPRNIKKYLDLIPADSPGKTDPEWNLDSLGKSSKACRYFGKLRNESQSSAAVTGCLNKPGDKMEITLISSYSKNTLFSVDFDGNTEIIKNPFEEGIVKSYLPSDL